MSDEWDFNNRFRPSSERVFDVDRKRREHAKQVFPFGIPYLDDYTRGIHPTDFVLIGAATGAGKTTLGALLAESAARRGKRVHFFALEAYEGEIEERLVFRALMRRVFKHEPRGFQHVTFASWRAGEVDSITDPFLDDAQRETAERLRLMSTYYRGEKFDADDVRRQFALIRPETDLIVLDHVHYIDSEDPNENRALKEITKALRDSALCIEKPVIAIGHLRKKDLRYGGPIPRLDDFHGSSDLTKIVTVSILLAPADDIESPSFISPTYMHIAKMRAVGACRQVALTDFHQRAMSYANNYQLGRFKKGEFERTLPGENPIWAKHARGTAPEREGL